jgi:hypothetical protein
VSLYEVAVTVSIIMGKLWVNKNVDFSTNCRYGRLVAQLDYSITCDVFHKEVVWILI